MAKLNRKLALMMVVVLLVGSIGLVGCTSNDTTPATDNGTETQEPVEVSIFQFKVEIAEALEAAAATYMEQNPNTKINIQTVGGGDDYGAALKAAFQSGNEPTIFNVGGPQDVKDWTHKLEDLSDAPWADQVLDGVLSGVTVDGKPYGLPFAIEGYGYAYNTAIFEAAGIDAEAITDYASFEAAVIELDEQIKSGALAEDFPLLEAVFEYAVKETWVTGLHTSNVVLGQEFDSALDAYAAETVEFEHADALKKLIDLNIKYSSNAETPAKLNAVDYTRQVEEGIAIERVAIIQQGNWIYGGVANIDPEVADNLAFLPMPVEGAIEDSIPVGVPMYWVVNKDKDDAERAAAKDFLNWLYTSEEGKQIVVNEFFFIPPMKGYDGLEPKDALGQSILKYAEAGRTTPWVFMGYPTQWGMDALGVNIQKYVAGEMTWDELIEESQAQWESMR